MVLKVILGLSCIVMGNLLLFKKIKIFLVEFFYFFRIIILFSIVDISVIFVCFIWCVCYILVVVVVFLDGFFVVVILYIV